MATKKTKALPPAPDLQDDRVEFVVKRFNASWDYARNNYHQLWINYWRLYNNQRIKRGYDGVSNVFVPMTFSTIETMVAALAGSKPSFNYLPSRDKPDQKTDTLNAAMDYYWDCDEWNIKVQSWIRSSLLYGTGAIYLYWDIDHPVMVNIPLRDFFFDPAAISMENNGTGFYAGRRYLTTKEDLASFEVVNPDTQEMTKKYKNLDNISTSAPDTTMTDKAQKEMFYGSTATDPAGTQVEVIELWTEDTVVSIANRTVVIQDEDNPYKVQAKKMGDKNPKGIIPFVVQRDFVDESLFYGKGEVEVFADLQEWLNDLTNQNSDAISFTLNPMWNLNPAKLDLIEQIQAAPGAVFPLGPTDLSPVAMPVIPRDAFNERMNIKNEIRETTAVDEVVKGTQSDKPTTATEINAQIAQAGARIGMKVTQLENEGFHRLARIVFEMMKLYVTTPMLIRVVGDSVSWQWFTPEDYAKGDYEPRVQLQINIEAKRKEEQQNAQQMYLALSQDPTIDQMKLKQLVLPKMFDLDPDEVNELLLQPQQAMGGMPGPDMGAPMPGQPGMQPPMPPQPTDPNLAPPIPAGAMV